MGLTNRQVIELLVKKGIVTTDDLSTGGKMNPAQALKFIDYVVDLTGLSQMSRVVRFKNEQMEINKLGVGRRVTMPAAEAKDPGVRRGVSTSKVVLQPVEQMSALELSDIFDEVNIEGDSVQDHIVRMMATQFGNDIEEMFITGDTLGQAVLESDLLDDGDDTRYVKDTFLAQMNGWLRRADSGHTVDAGGAAISANIFSQALNALPIKFRRQRQRLRFFVSPDLEQLMRERLSTRSTASGDDALTNANNIRIFGVEVVPVALMPFNPTIVEHITFTGSASTVTLRYSGLVSGSLVVTATSLSKTPVDPYEVATDYTVDYSAGTITHAGGGSSIGTTATVKVTYQAGPQVICTHADNMITAIGRDVRIEKDRDIFARLDQWAITTKVDCTFEEVDAVSKVFNIASTL
jgi:hypothetical protein